MRFLDGRQAGTITLVAASLQEGQFRFDGTELTTDRRGRTYYVKPVPDQRWAHGEIPEWTAALDDGTYP